MTYLLRAFGTLKKVHWEKLTASLKHMGYFVLVIVAASGFYWVINYLMTMILKKL